MGYNPNICHLQVGYNPFTNQFLTSWDIQVASTGISESQALFLLENLASSSAAGALEDALAEAVKARSLGVFWFFEQTFKHAIKILVQKGMIYQN